MPKGTVRNKPGAGMSKQTTIRTGDMDNNRGTINIAGESVVTGLSAAEVARLFREINSDIDKKSKTTQAKKKKIKAEVKEIKAAVADAAGNDRQLKGFLAERFRNIARMAPDALDVVVAALANPLAGLGVAAKKIADKAREDAKAT